MKLSYLSESVIPSQAANSVQVMKMSAALASEGIIVSLHARMPDERDLGDPYRYYGVVQRFKIHWGWYARNWRGRAWLYGLHGALKARLDGVDVAYCRCPYSALMAAKLGIPTVFEAHSVPMAGSKRDTVVFPALFKQRSFIGVVSITAALARDLIVRYQLSPDCVLVAPDGADVPLEGLNPMQLRTQNRLCVGYVGHLYPGKGMEIILPLTAACPDMDFHVVGGTEELIAYWRDKASSLSNLSFHGFVPPEQTGGYISAFDVVLAPLQERVSASGGDDIAAWTSPLKIFEYMSHGRAVIASDLPVLREVLRHEENCLLALPGEVAAWAKSLRRLNDDGALRGRLESRAKKDFILHYTWRSRAQKIAQFICSRTGSAN